MRLDKTEVWGFEHAARGMRNPVNSWDQSDSIGEVIGPKDLILMKKLIKAGSDHRKFMRQIFVSVDISAPLYWWKEFDTYKVGPTANSCSTMHKITSKLLELEDFELDAVIPRESFVAYINMINLQITLYQSYDKNLADGKITKEDVSKKQIFRSIIQMLPSSYIQKRTVTLTFENLLSMYLARKNHKLQEWHQFCGWLIEIPYMRELLKEVE